jgi:putative nucleotidyltransferase with HDIG domain
MHFSSASGKDTKGLNRSETRRIVRRLGGLPTVPAVAAKILKIFTEGNPDLDEVIELIETDQSITMKILKLVNSAYYGLPSRISSIKKAVLMLGASEVRCVLLSVTVSESLIKGLREKGPNKQEDLWKHSLACAVCAEMIAGKSCPGLKAEAFVGGLLHDVGKLILLECFPDKTEEVKMRHTEQGISWSQAEQDILGVDHATVGKWLAEKWNLPQIFVQAIWLHHHPLNTIQELAFVKQKEAILTIRLANILAHKTMADFPASQSTRIDYGDILDFLHMKPDDMDELSASLGKNYCDRASLLDMEEDEPSFYYHALQRANQELAKLASENAPYKNLKKTVQELGYLHELHLELADIEDAESVLDRVVQTITSKLEKPKGAIYYLNYPEKRLIGIRWFPEKPFQAFTAPLDEKGLPFLENTPGINEDLNRLICSSPIRFPRITDENRQLNAIHYCSPYFVIPLISGDQILGEIGIDDESKGVFDGLSRHDKLNNFGYLASITGTALSRIELLEELRETAESLSSTLSKNAQIGMLLKKSISEKQEMEKEILRAQKFESIGIIAGGIAHDFNNILTAISGNVSLAKMYLKPAEKAFEKLTQAEKASFRAKDLTRQLLTFSKTGGAPDKTTISVAELARDSAGFALRGSNVQLKFSLPDSLSPVEADEGQINQVINNLIINASQAMPEGGTIWLAAENVTVSGGNGSPLKRGKYVKITIKDTGIGIPEAILPKIFDPYFTTKPKGSGLGLATAYSIIKKHDGHINVESEPNAGTTFFLYLPASQKEGVTPKREEKKPHGGNGKILIMDDEKEIRDLVGEMLKSIGYEVEFAIDGTEAIKTYELAKKTKNPFDVVITDLTVPGGMGGKEAIQKLREIDPEVRGIVSSGYTNDPVMIDFKKYGFTDVIAKPYKLAELSEVLYRTLKSPVSISTLAQSLKKPEEMPSGTPGLYGLGPRAGVK